MSDPSVEALTPLNLQPGRTYRCQVNGRRVVLRVLEDIPPEMMPAPLVESDIMLDPWVELPAPSGGIKVTVRPGELPPPDLPEIPDDGIVTICWLGEPDLPDPVELPDTD